MRRDQLALREYERAIEVAGGYEISRRNGIYQVGSKDLADARRTVRNSNATPRLRRRSDLLETGPEPDAVLLGEMEKFSLRVRRSIEISAPTGIVWKYLNDFERYPEFCDSVRAAGLKGDGRVGWKTVVGVARRWRGMRKSWSRSPTRRLSWRSTTPMAGAAP